MKKIFYILLPGILSAGIHQSLQAQTYIKMGSNANSGQDFNYSICQTGSYYIASGTMMNNTTHNLDISVICRDATGSVLWNRTYDINGGSDDFSGKIRATYDGVIIAGTTGGQFGHPKNMFALHLDFAGNILGQAIYSTFSPGQINTYGFDVTYEPSDGTYIIAGMGDYTVSNTISESRFGIIMKVSSDLQTIIWSNKYVTSPSGYAPYYDCIGDIERVANASGIYYYLTGSITHPVFGVQEGVLNMLIDNTGTVVWDNPFDASNSADLGCNAVYDDANNRLYVLHENSAGHTPNIAAVDFSTGALIADNYVEPLQQTDNMAYAIEWSDNTHTHVVMHGIVNYFTSSCTNPAINYLVEFDPANPSSFSWERTYPPAFSGADLTALSYDFVLKPSYSQLSPLFFVPHTFVPNYDISSTAPFYTVIGTSQTTCGSGIMKNLMFQTNNSGNFITDLCFNSSGAYASGAVFTNSVTPGVYSTYPMQVLQVAPALNIPVRNDVSACPYMRPASAAVQNETKTISLYPNPATDEINIALPADTHVKTIYVEDALGNKADYSAAITGNPIQLNIANLATGIYYLQLFTPGEVKHFKFVKQ